jgi:two-component system, OmpR family, sensor histidine kinase KdpD
VKNARPDARPDPDALLARVKEEQARERRGKLKVFFGAAAGVGKTYAMLEAARGQRAAGVDVVIGWVETHGRAETEALLPGLERLPTRAIEYRGATLRELDLDAALARRPALILVDELAHTNAPGSRHTKRWQDVTELLASGIDVYTTLNVQHLESLNDVVTRVTEVPTRETVPDSILEEATEVELVDLSPDDLIQRLKEGKVYVPEQASEAIRRFFRKGNLIALRELALRTTAARVDAQMEVYRRDHAVPGIWPVAERILVCVSPSPLAARVVRAARRMATGLRAEWVVVTVETPATARMSSADRDRTAQTLRLAEQLGAETVTLTGDDVSTEILTYARRRNVTRIVLGKPARPRWRETLFGSVVNELVRRSGDIDVYVITGEREGPQPAALDRPAPPVDWAGYVKAVGLVAACTGLASLMFRHFAPANLIMVYLLGTVLAAWWLGRGPSILVSVLSVAAFDFFFVTPYLTFAVSDTQYIVTFGVMLAVAIVISTLTTRIRAHAEASRQRERRTAALYAMTRDLVSRQELDELLQAAVRHIAEASGGRVALFLPGPDGALVGRAGELGPGTDAPGERAVAQWVHEHGQMAGRASATLPGARALYLPLTAPRGTVGVLGIDPPSGETPVTPEQLHLLETFAAQTALAIERVALVDEAQQARLRSETERLRNSLLSAVSHDLRTPLATITGSASALVEQENELDAAERRELAQAIQEEADRLNRLVQNLLEMTRLESGGVQVRKDWHPLEEVVGSALARVEKHLGRRRVEIRLPPDLPLVPLDPLLVEQVLINLLDNAIKYAPSDAPIEISAAVEGQAVSVTVADRGPGFAPGEETRVFEKFYRGQDAGKRSGAGLGLAIARGMVEVHGGQIVAESRPGGGALFRFSLPLMAKPPEVRPDDG